MRRLSMAVLLLAFSAHASAQESLDCAALANSAAKEPQAYAVECGVTPARAPAPVDSSPRAPTDTGNAYNMSTFGSQGFSSYVLNAFGTQTFIGNPGANIYALDYDPTGTTLHAIQTITAGSPTYGTINPATGALTTIGPVTGLGASDVVSGLTIDGVTGAAYITAGAGAGTGSLYSFNLATGAATLIGAHGVAGALFVDIAINCTGDMYGHDIASDSLYSINKTTGAATLIGPHGLASNFAQGMDFDNNDGTLYAAIYTGSGTYTYGTFNLTTGAITPLSTNTPAGEWELAIPTTCGPVVPPTETEPNDTKAQANTIQLPGTDREGVMNGNSISSSTTGIDTYLVKTAAQAPGFYRHRLLVTSTIAGHTISIRGLTQTAGAINAGTDAAVQTSAATTTPARFIQWYTTGAAADLYVRVTGTTSTTADYRLDYDIEPVTVGSGPVGIAPGSATITTVGQTTVDTDMWVYNGARAAIAGFGNDDELGTTNAQSVFTRVYDPGVYYLAISNYNLANDQASPADDDFRAAPVVDFPGIIAGSNVNTTAVDLDAQIAGTPVTIVRNGAFDVQFVRFIVGAYELEGNDDKATANALVLPASNASSVFSGSSTSATGAGLDYVRVTTAPQATDGFYRHRLILSSTTPGHAFTIRGLTQTAGVINAGTDAAAQTASATTTPARYVQWYTTEDPADIYIRVAGTATTTADYSLEYTIEPVVPVAGPAVTSSPVTITTVGQTTVDTDLWVYDGNRLAIPGYGNDDQFNATPLQSELIRAYPDGNYTLAISNFAFMNDQASPADDDFRTGTVLDFPGALLNSSTTLNTILNPSIGGTSVPITRAGPFEVDFVTFSASGDTIFKDGFD
ncbi:MAG: hypothetical protein J0L88_01640 [Xanthomonadales bacterium]|nr:hypothetical protein [Xanthomonadales bacterium]